MDQLVQARVLAPQLWISGDNKSDRNIKFLSVREPQAGEKRFCGVDFFRPNQKEAVAVNNMRHQIQTYISAVKDVQAIPIQGASRNHITCCRRFPYFGTRLDHNVGIPFLQQIIHQVDVKLMVASLVGIVGYERRTVCFICGDVQV